MQAKARPRSGKIIGLSILGLLALGCLVLAYRLVPFGRRDAGAASIGRRANGDFAYAVPLDPRSPWPKFRANELQSGRSPVLPLVHPGLKTWVFPTGKGIFSSPVIGADGSVYIGSADQRFYALDASGKELWSVLTGGIIDSSALLDDRGRVIVAGGDGLLYCLERSSGRILWKARADSPEEAARKYAVPVHNVGWFEGNVALLPDGTILAPNDNQLLYAFDREGGAFRRVYKGNEMIWSLPAIDTRRGRLYFATQNLALKTVFAYDLAGEKPLWTNGGLGSVAASPLLSSDRPGALLLAGGFDGYLRAYQASSGKQLWSFAARDHIYASPAQLSDGSIVQPSADGSVYCVDASSGRRLWSFDTGEAIRSSPAVDGADQVYFGGGDGRLYCLNRDGSLRWSYLCIEGERNDLNSSPALGPEGVVIGGEDGGVFFVPYDYPLTEAGKRDPRASTAPRPALGRGKASLVYTTSFGSLEAAPPARIEANERLTFTLVARQGASVQAARLESKGLAATARDSGGRSIQLDLRLSADGRFITILPVGYWAPAAGDSIALSIEGYYRTGLARLGLKAFGGRRAGRIVESLSFAVAPRGGGALPYAVPAAPGERAGAFALSRYSAPNPTMLPSWNQIGFDSLHYVAGIVEGRGSKALVWVVAGRLDPATGATLVDPGLAARFPLELGYDGGLLTLSNQRGFKINFVGSWDMPFGYYRVAAKADQATGAIVGQASLDAVALCDQIPFYGFGLKLLGLSDWSTGQMTVAGGLKLETLGSGPRTAPPGAGSASFALEKSEAKGKTGGLLSVSVSGASLKKTEHNFSLLLVDSATGEALPLYYTGRTSVQADGRDVVDKVSVAWSEDYRGRSIRAYYLVDAYPVAVGKLEL